MSDVRPVDPVDRAHLTGATRPSPPIHRYAPSSDLTELVERYWIPVWSVPAPQRQSTLQHPVCLVVVSNTYARLYGVTRGMSTVTLEGTGWAAGVMLRPATGRLLLGRSLATLVDTYLDLADVDRIDAWGLVERVRAAMADDPSAEESHRTVIAAYEEALRGLLPVDPPGLVVNRLVDWLRDHPEVTRVAEVAAEAGLGERALQRLTEQRIGLSPKWLIQRRRLHDVVERIKAGRASLADVAAELGYADQAHFIHDFRAVTGLTPGQYLADQPPR